jgi:hypothetical protein
MEVVQHFNHSMLDYGILGIRAAHHSKLLMPLIKIIHKA